MVRRHLHTISLISLLRYLDKVKAMLILDLLRIARPSRLENLIALSCHIGIRPTRSTPACCFLPYGLTASPWPHYMQITHLMERSVTFIV
jgi:hypothetical protein